MVGSGKDVCWDSGRFIIDGLPVSSEKIAEYDELGALEWASEEARSWFASQVEKQPRPAVAQPESARAEAAPRAVPAVTSRQADLLPKRKPARPAVVLTEAAIELAVVLGLALYLPDIPARVYVVAIGVAYFALVAVSLVPAAGRSKFGRTALGTATGALSIAAVVVLLPCAIQVGMWAGRPLPIRAEGELPEVSKMLGRGIGDAKRMLDFPKTWRRIEGEPVAYAFALPDVRSADASPTIGLISVNASGQVDSVFFSMTAEKGAYLDLQQLLSDRMGYQGRLSGQSVITQAGLSGVCRLEDASPTCSAQFVAAPKSDSVISVRLTFARTVAGDEGPALAPSDLALDGWTGSGAAGASQSHKGKTLYALIGESVKTRSDAENGLARIKSRYGQALPWTVETSDHFAGLRPGWNVVMVAFLNRQAADDAARLMSNKSWHPYVRTVIKNCDDPIVAY
jgi:hypothetical protein